MDPNPIQDRLGRIDGEEDCLADPLRSRLAEQLARLRWLRRGQTRPLIAAIDGVIGLDESSSERVESGEDCGEGFFELGYWIGIGCGIEENDCGVYWRGLVV